MYAGPLPVVRYLWLLLLLQCPVSIGNQCVIFVTLITGVLVNRCTDIPRFWKGPYKVTSKVCVQVRVLI